MASLFWMLEMYADLIKHAPPPPHSLTSEWCMCIRIGRIRYGKPINNARCTEGCYSEHCSIRGERACDPCIIQWQISDTVRVIAKIRADGPHNNVQQYLYTREEWAHCIVYTCSSSLEQTQVEMSKNSCAGIYVQRRWKSDSSHKEDNWSRPWLDKHIQVSRLVLVKFRNNESNKTSKNMYTKIRSRRLKQSQCGSKNRNLSCSRLNTHKQTNKQKKLFWWLHVILCV